MQSESLNKSCGQLHEGTCTEKDAEQGEAREINLELSPFSGKQGTRFIVKQTTEL